MQSIIPNINSYKTKIVYIYSLLLTFERSLFVFLVLREWNVSLVINNSLLTPGKVFQEYLHICKEAPCNINL